MPRARAALALSLAISTLVPTLAEARDCAAGAKDVEATVRAWFDAGRSDNLEAMARLQTPDFYAFDASRRFQGMELGQLLRQLHSSGVVIVWNLGPIDAHADCDLAWASWLNHGEAGNAGKMQPLTWQESAVLRHDGGRWRMVFLHSSRVVEASH